MLWDDFRDMCQMENLDSQNKIKSHYNNQPDYITNFLKKKNRMTTFKNGRNIFEDISP